MTTGDNPYEAPRAELGRVLGVRSGLQKDLRDVAVAQKGILICILLQILLFGSQFVVPPGLRVPAQVTSLVTSLVGTVFVFMLSIKVYHMGLGILFGLFAMIPCVGLVVLLLVNSRATRILQQNGYKVGLLGADINSIPRG